MQVSSTTHTQLTAAGNGTSVNMSRIQPTAGVGKVVIANINTNVVVRYDYSDDGFTTTYKGEEYTYTANGNYVVPVVPGFEECRPVFVSESGGTAVTVDVTTELFY